MKMARILLADDELDLADLLAEVLRAEGHEVRVAADGLAALITIRNWRPDVAILDVDMPIMRGPSVAAELSKDQRGLETIRVVLLSGNADVKDVAAAAGIKNWITKPVTMEE